MKEACIARLRKLTRKKHIFFTDRGNSAIMLALRFAKSSGMKRLLIQDQGGWITYGQYARKLKFETQVIKTDFGLVDEDAIKGRIDASSALLLNSMPGYYALQGNMSSIRRTCQAKGCILINDVSGSIGASAAKYGDIILGSFGEWKPLEVKYGGFIATDSLKTMGFFMENYKKDLRDFFHELKIQLDQLDIKTRKMFAIQEKIKGLLKDFDILHRDAKGFNVIVKYANEDQKMKILDFCKVYGYEFTLCPRYIRVLEQAVSIEAKR